MNNPFSKSLSLLSLSLASLLVVSGCRPAEEISTRTVKAPAKPVATAPTPPVERGEPTHRMLAAILQAGDQAWFIKAVGPSEAIASTTPTIEEFLKSVRVEDGRPVWELPEEWTEKPAGQMRLATLVAPVEGAPDGIELSVIGLPIVGDWSAQVLSNVNRWRKQLGRDPVTPAQLSETTTPLSVVEGAVLMDETGWFASGGMSNAPFANAPFAHPPMTKPVDPVPPRPPSTELKFDRPEGWTDKPGSAMRKASLATSGGAEVTAFAFPSTAPAMADPLANINRWRREIGLEATTAEKLADESSKITLSGGPATYAELVGPTETTYAAMTTRGNLVWFFKLRGPNEAVDAEREAFKAWIASMQIEE